MPCVQLILLSLYLFIKKKCLAFLLYGNSIPVFEHRDNNMTREQKSKYDVFHPVQGPSPIADSADVSFGKGVWERIMLYMECTYLVGSGEYSMLYHI